MSWTPGPWQAEIVADGTQLIDLYDARENVIGCPDNDHGSAGWYHLENPADGELIVLAPDMAAQVIMQADGCYSGSMPCYCADGIHDLADKLRAIKEQA